MSTHGVLPGYPWEYSVRSTPRLPWEYPAHTPCVARLPEADPNRTLGRCGRCVCLCGPGLGAVSLYMYIYIYIYARLCLFVSLGVSVRVCVFVCFLRATPLRLADLRHSEGERGESKPRPSDRPNSDASAPESRLRGCAAREHGVLTGAAGGTHGESRLRGCAAPTVLTAQPKRRPRRANTHCRQHTNRRTLFCVCRFVFFVRLFVCSQLRDGLPPAGTCTKAEPPASAARAVQTAD